METWFDKYRPEVGWNEELQREFDDECKKHVDAGNVDEVTIVVVASKKASWLPVLRQNFLPYLLEGWLWPDEKSPHSIGVIRRRSDLAIRLAGNCCVEDPQSHYLVLKHMSRVKQCIADEELCGVTIGLFWNMVTGNEVSKTVATTLLKEYEVQREIARCVASRNIHWTKDHFNTGLDLLISLAEHDLAFGVPAPEASAAALRILVAWILDGHQDPRLAGWGPVIEVIAHWASSDCVIKSLRTAARISHEPDPMLNLITVFERTFDLDSGNYDAWEDDEHEEIDSQTHNPWVVLLNAISEMAHGFPSDDNPVETAQLIMRLLKFIRLGESSPQRSKFSALGFKVLVNIIQTERLAIVAVSNFPVHMAAVEFLTRCKLPSEDRLYQDIAYAATTLLANLSISEANKESVIGTHIVATLFSATESGGKNGLAIHILRKLMSNSPNISRLVVKPGTPRTLLSFEDLKTALPDQKALFRSYESLKKGNINALQSGLCTRRQLTTDIGRMLVSILRVVPLAAYSESGANGEVTMLKYLAPEHVRCLCNLTRLGYLHGSNIQDASEGLFGLGLALKQPAMAEYIVDCLAWDDFLPMKAAIANSTQTAWQKSRQDKDNALFILAKLLPVSGEKSTLIEELLREGEKARRVELVEDGNEGLMSQILDMGLI